MITKHHKPCVKLCSLSLTWACIMGASIGAAIKSKHSTLEWSVADNKSQFVTAATLSSNGLLLGKNKSHSSSYRLEVQGNVSISGPLRTEFEEIKDDAILDKHNLYFINSSDKPLRLTFPDASTRSGQAIEIIKTGGDKDIYLFSDNITGADNLAIKGNSNNSSLRFRSNGKVWYLGQTRSYEDGYTPSHFKTTLDYWTQYSSNLLCHWKFDEPEGDQTYEDSSLLYHRSTNVVGKKMSSSQDGIDGLSAQRTENSGLVTDELDDLSGMAQLSISVWIKPNALDTTQKIVSLNSGSSADNIIYELQLNKSNKKIQFSTATGENKVLRSVTSNHIIKTQWTHIVATTNCDEKTTRIYINGTRDKSSTFDHHDPITKVETNEGHKLYVICNQDTGKLGLKGHIDDLRIYNRELDQDDVKDLYKAYEHDTNTTGP